MYKNDFWDKSLSFLCWMIQNEINQIYFIADF